MSPQLASLIAANIVFVGGHFVLSHPFRPGLAASLGERVFLALYSLVQIAVFAWIVVAFRAVGPGGALLWNGQSDTLWAIASLMTVIAFALLLGSFRGNPAMPGTTPETVEIAKPYGAFAITRHPMMWGIAIWAFAHILVAPNARTTITAGSMAVLALLGSYLQDRKKEVLLGQAWNGWESRTTFSPRLRHLGALGFATWTLAVVAWLLITWAHIPLVWVPAGIWRWLG
jgi:uncharacterized membrane protein